MLSAAKQLYKETSMIEVQFYGVLQEAAGQRSMSFPLSAPAPVADVLEQLQGQLPGLSQHLPRLACAIDDRIVPRNHTIHPGATLALLPPVSGG